MPISQGKVTLNSGKPTKFAGHPAARSVAISAPGTNEATIYVGGSEGVTTATGFPLEPGQTVSLDASGGLEDVWVVGTAGDALGWLAAV